MKRQTQVAGVRRWFGDDMLELQSEPLKALDALVSTFNKPFVISGCVRQPDESVTPGFVALGVEGEEGLKIMPFIGYRHQGLFWIIARKKPVNSVYADGVSRLSAYQYEAWGVRPYPPDSPVEPPSYIEVTTPGRADRITDVMQDSNHRFVSDYQKGIWDAAKQQAIDSAKLYTDTRESATREFIGQVETGIHNITSSLESTKATKEEVALKANKTEVALKANSSSTMVELPSTGANIPESYLTRIGTWRASTGDSSIRGRWLSLGDSTEQFQLRFSYPTGQGMKIEAQGCSTNACFSAVTLLHSGNTMQVYVAGRISGDGSYPDTYKGPEVSLNKMATAKYRVTHYLGNTNYMVNITPMSSAAKSFAITDKSETSFEVQFNLTTDFEFQVLKY